VMTAATPGVAAALPKKPLLPPAPEPQALRVAVPAVAPASALAHAAETTRLLPEPVAPPSVAKNESDTLTAPVLIAEVATKLVVTQPPPWVEIPAEAKTPPATQTSGSSELCEVWNQTVARLVTAEAVAALTRELALQSELRSQAGGVWTLRVERESLNQAAAKEKLQLALQTALADPALRIAVEIGPVTDTPARRNTAAAIERQREAEETIHNDPFVQDMIRDWGAKIVPGSIKPITARTT